MSDARIAEIQEKIAGRTDAQGKPLKGYAQNIAVLRQELATLLAHRTPTVQDSVEGLTAQPT